MLRQSPRIIVFDGAEGSTAGLDEREHICVPVVHLGYICVDPFGISV